MTLTPNCLEIAWSNERHKRRNFEKTKHQRNLNLKVSKIQTILRAGDVFSIKASAGIKTNYLTYKIMSIKTFNLNRFWPFRGLIPIYLIGCPESEKRLEFLIISFLTPCTLAHLNLSAKRTQFGPNKTSRWIFTEMIL